MSHSESSKNLPRFFPYSRSNSCDGSCKGGEFVIFVSCKPFEGSIKTLADGFIKLSLAEICYCGNG